MGRLIYTRFRSFITLTDIFIDSIKPFNHSIRHKNDKHAMKRNFLKASFLLFLFSMLLWRISMYILPDYITILRGRHAYRHISFEWNALAFSTRMQIYSRDNANMHCFYKRIYRNEFPFSKATQIWWMITVCRLQRLLLERWILHFKRIRDYIWGGLFKFKN